MHCKDNTTNLADLHNELLCRAIIPNSEIFPSLEYTRDFDLVLYATT